MKGGLTMNIIQQLESEQLRDDIPLFRAGDTLRVRFKVFEGGKERIQIIDGIVLMRKGSGVKETFTIRKISHGVGLERTFPLHTPRIDSIEVLKWGDVNRAKLYYLRKKMGRAARVKEKRRRRR